MQALRKSVSSPVSSPMLVTNAGALDAETSDPGTQFMARSQSPRDDGRGAPFLTSQSNSAPADKFIRCEMTTDEALQVWVDPPEDDPHRYIWDLEMAIDKLYEISHKRDGVKAIRHELPRIKSELRRLQDLVFDFQDMMQAAE